jgi:hypothetical protein
MDMASITHPEPKAPSRRALLAGAMGGIGAWAAAAIGRASPTHAANGDPVLVGGSHSGTGATSITNSGSPIAFIGVSTAATNDTTGIFGQANGSTGRGVLGFAPATSGANYGVWGQSNSPDGRAVFGWNSEINTGVYGSSSEVAPNMLPNARRTGVYGFSDRGSFAKGVWGRSPGGHGLHGESSSGWAGFFDGRLFVKKYVELVEIGTPSAPNGNHARLFVRANSNGKTQLCVRFHTGAVRVLATQP